MLNTLGIFLKLISIFVILTIHTQQYQEVFYPQLLPDINS